MQTHIQIYARFANYVQIQPFNQLYTCLALNAPSNALTKPSASHCSGTTSAGNPHFVRASAVTCPIAPSTIRFFPCAGFQSEIGRAHV